MNKYHTQSTLKLFLLIVIAFSSGCTQSTAIDSPFTQTPRSDNSIETEAELSCVSSTQSTTSDIVKEADEWFLSSNSQIPSRNQYSAWKEWGKSLETICGNYQTAILNNESWIHNPTNLALRTFTFSEYFIPDSIIAIAMPQRNNVTFQNQTFETYMEHNAVTVVYSIFQPSQGMEIRVDLVREDGIWKIRWLGSRWKCYENNNTDWQIDSCP